MSDATKGLGQDYPKSSAGASASSVEEPSLLLRNAYAALLYAVTCAEDAGRSGARELKAESGRAYEAAEKAIRALSPPEGRASDGAASVPVEPTDTERLDWLEANRVSLYRATHEEIRPTTASFNSYERVQVFDGWCTGMSDEPKPTLRAAIDAARLPPKEPGGT